MDVEDMEHYFTFYKFGFICCYLALYCEPIICVTCVFKVTMKVLQIMCSIFLES